MGSAYTAENICKEAVEVLNKKGNIALLNLELKMKPEDVLVALADPDQKFEMLYELRENIVKSKNLDCHEVRVIEHYWDHVSRKDVFRFAESNDEVACSRIRLAKVQASIDEAGKEVEALLGKILAYIQPSGHYMVKREFATMLLAHAEKLKDPYGRP